jgi:hypothetical protein
LLLQDEQRKPLAVVSDDLLTWLTQAEHQVSAIDVRMCNPLDLPAEIGW